MTTHDLKTWPPHFAALWDGTKRAELRRADRPFAVGDALCLREWDPTMYEWAIGDGCDHEEATEFAYSGRQVWARITHIVSGGPWLVEGYVMLRFALMTLEEVAAWTI